MKWISSRRPSPAMIVALLALFVSLSGVSYGVATGFIDSREIKNNEVRSVDIRNNQIRTRDLRNNEVRGIDIRNSTVRGRDIALNTVTGEDVNEATLQKVPSAMLADSATSANSANSVSTLKIIPVTTVAEGADPVVLASHGPFTLRGECAASGATVTVSSTESGSQKSEPPAQQDLYVASPIAALAPSGKGFTGDVALYRDGSANVCRFHGSLALQG